MKIKDDEILVLQFPSSFSDIEVTNLVNSLQRYMKKNNLKFHFMIIEDNIKLNKMTYDALERTRDRIESELRFRKYKNI